jgi:hypothetical protein
VHRRPGVDLMNPLRLIKLHLDQKGLFKVI